MNTITIHGRLTGDPESKQSQNGQAIANFSLADNHGKDNQGQDKATFFRCSAFGKSAELILNSCKKGHLLTVTGRLESSQYTNQQGQQATSLNVTLDRFGFCEPMNSGGQQQAAPPNQQRPPQQGYGAPPTAQQYQQQGAYVPPPQQGYGAAPVPGGYQQQPGPQYGGQAPQPPAPPQHSYNQPPQQPAPQGYPPQQAQQPAPWSPQQSQQPQQQYPPGWDPNRDVPF